MAKFSLGHINSDESNKFFETSDGGTGVKVSSFTGTDIDPAAKYLELTLTSATVETYKYYESSSKTILYNTIVVEYVDSSKDTIVSVEWS